MAICRFRLSVHSLSFLARVPSQFNWLSGKAICIAYHSLFIEIRPEFIFAPTLTYPRSNRAHLRSNAFSVSMGLKSEPSPEAQSAMLRKGGLIRRKLEEVYPQAPVGFLHNKDPFTLLVAVLLSAQTLDKKVNEVTPELFKVAGTPEQMHKLGEDCVREIIRPIGLAPQKARNLVRLAAIICNEHDGEVPSDLEALKKLPGVGHKTASVILIQAFGKPAFPVDTHIHRLACRWGCGDPKSVARTEETLKQWFPDPGSWAHLHTRIILFGREHCGARKHDMDSCPICSFAATDEARAANSASPNKFIAALSHNDPYSIREALPSPQTFEAVGSGSSQVMSGVKPSSKQNLNQVKKKKTKLSSSSVQKSDTKNNPKRKKAVMVEEKTVLEMTSAKLDPVRTGTPSFVAEDLNKVKIKSSRKVKKGAKANNKPTKVATIEEEEIIVTSSGKEEQEIKEEPFEEKVTKSSVAEMRGMKSDQFSAAGEFEDLNLRKSETGMKNIRKDRYRSMTEAMDNFKPKKNSKRKINSNGDGGSLSDDDNNKSCRTSKKIRSVRKPRNMTTLNEGDTSVKNSVAASEQTSPRRSGRLKG